jgi:hypothetical protein
MALDRSTAHQSPPRENIPHESMSLFPCRHFTSLHAQVTKRRSDRSNTNPVFLGLLIKTFNGVVVRCGDCACAGWSRNFDQQPSTWSAAAVLTRTVPRRPATLPPSCPTTKSIALTNLLRLKNVQKWRESTDYNKSTCSCGAPCRAQQNGRWACV